MINLAIAMKTLKDSALALAVSLAGMVAFVVLFAWAMLNMGTELMEFVSKIGFLKKLFEMAFSIRVDGDLSLSIMFAVCFTHGMVLLMSWAPIVSTCSRVTAGEVERGTADLLLTLPVTRATVYLSTTLVWAVAAVALAFCPIVGIWIATLVFVIDEPIELGRYVQPAVNFVALLLAVGGVTSLISAWLNRRGPAIATVIALGVASMVLNFLEPFIEQIQSIRFLGLFNYYRPVDVVRTSEWPTLEITILLTLGVISWALGLLIFGRKDIPTG